MRVLLCCDPLEPEAVDSAYLAEAEAANAVGLSVSRIDFEALVDEGDPKRAVRKVRRPESGEELGVYRGWMLSPTQYRDLYNALSERQVRLINTPESYRHCYYLPQSYSVIEQMTPKSVWLPKESPIGVIMDALKDFGERPVIVKDYVKSRKHEWDEACYIPNASDEQKVDRVVRRFVELQGETLAEGLVFREFIDLEPIGTHPKSKMPLTNEHRLFYLDGRVMLGFAYWADVGQVAGDIPRERFESVAREIRSRFFTMDVAKRKEGDWLIIELGDGQVAGLPDDSLCGEFYRALHSSCST